ncbi:MAG: hypothetical protein H6Q17_768 [Bacteroidetes bacterium]|nr:hypothetical protein [Bacteroidota bacterium]
MADNSGNIIYIIAVIVAVLSSFLSKAKKSKVDEFPTPSTPTKSWQDVIREMTQPEEEHTKPVVLPEQPRFNKMHSQPFLDVEQKVHKDNLVTHAHVPNNTSNVAEEPAEHVTLPDFSNLDEVKRGIIFNEIFHRKF